MRRTHVGLVAVAAAVGLSAFPGTCAGRQAEAVSVGSRIQLPAPRVRGTVSVEEALASRRTVRSFAESPIRLDELGQMLWAAQGVTDRERGRRAAPSAGALYPLETFVVSGGTAGLPAGVYRYRTGAHELELVRTGDVRPELASRGGCQEWVTQAPAVIVIGAVFQRTTTKYGERGRRYVHIEAGHAAENVCLQAVALGLGAGVVGSFADSELGRVVGAGAGEEALYLVAVGRPR